MSRSKRNVRTVKNAAMRTPTRDILVLLKNEFASQQSIEQEVEYLNHILIQSESFEQFCIAHELAERRRITSKPKKIRRAIRFVELKPFQFLINKN
jgi:hypothetical protein